MLLFLIAYLAGALTIVSPCILSVLPYQLLRRSDGAGEHLFEIEFPDPGAQVFAFTFG